MRPRGQLTACPPTSSSGCPPPQLPFQLQRQQQGAQEQLQLQQPAVSEAVSDSGSEEDDQQDDPDFVPATEHADRPHRHHPRSSTSPVAAAAAAGAGTPRTKFASPPKGTPTLFRFWGTPTGKGSALQQRLDAAASPPNKQQQAQAGGVAGGGGSSAAAAAGPAVATPASQQQQQLGSGASSSDNALPSAGAAEAGAAAAGAAPSPAGGDSEQWEEYFDDGCCDDDAELAQSDPLWAAQEQAQGQQQGQQHQHQQEHDLEDVLAARHATQHSPLAAAAAAAAVSPAKRGHKRSRPAAAQGKAAGGRRGRHAKGRGACSSATWPLTFLDSSAHRTWPLVPEGSKELLPPIDSASVRAHVASRLQPPAAGTSAATASRSDSSSDDSDDEDFEDERPRKRAAVAAAGGDRAAPAAAAPAAAAAAGEPPAPAVNPSDKLFMQPPVDSWQEVEAGLMYGVELMADGGLRFWPFRPAFQDLFSDPDKRGQETAALTAIALADPCHPIHCNTLQPLSQHPKQSEHEAQAPEDVSGGRMLVALQPLPAGTFVGAYIAKPGGWLTSREAQRRANADLSNTAAFEEYQMTLHWTHLEFIEGDDKDEVFIDGDTACCRMALINDSKVWHRELAELGQQCAQSKAGNPCYCSSHKGRRDNLVQHPCITKAADGSGLPVVLFFTATDVAEHQELIWGYNSGSFFRDQQTSRRQLAHVTALEDTSRLYALELQRQLQQLLAAADAAVCEPAAASSIQADAQQLLPKLEQMFEAQHERQQNSSIALLDDLLSHPPDGDGRSASRRLQGLRNAWLHRPVTAVLLAARGQALTGGRADERVELPAYMQAVWTQLADRIQQQQDAEAHARAKMQQLRELLPRLRAGSAQQQGSRPHCEAAPRGSAGAGGDSTAASAPATSATPAAEARGAAAAAGADAEGTGTESELVALMRAQLAMQRQMMKMLCEHMMQPRRGDSATKFG